jgi:hypothetical protein
MPQWTLGRPPDKPREFWTSPRLSPLAWAGFDTLLRERSANDMSTRVHFLYRVDMWTIDGESVIEHLAGVEDFKVAMATYRAACDRWPGTVITLRQGAQVIESPIRLRQEA